MQGLLGSLLRNDLFFLLEKQKLDRLFKNIVDINHLSNLHISSFEEDAIHYVISMNNFLQLTNLLQRTYIESNNEIPGINTGIGPPYTERTEKYNENDNHVNSDKNELYKNPKHHNSINSFSNKTGVRDNSSVEENSYDKHSSSSFFEHESLSSSRKSKKYDKKKSKIIKQNKNKQAQHQLNIKQKKKIKLESRTTFNLSIKTNLTSNPSISTDNILSRTQSLIKPNTIINEHNDKLNKMETRTNPEIKSYNSRFITKKTFNSIQGPLPDLKKKIRRRRVKKLAKLSCRSDCIRKRIKTYINNYILNKLNSLVINRQDIFFFKLPMEFIINIRYRFNNLTLKKTVKEIFSSNPPAKSDAYRVEHNKRMIEKEYSSSPFFRDFVDKPFPQVFNEYLNSDQYLSDLAVLVEKEGDDYVNLYHIHMLNFLNHFDIDSVIDEKDRFHADFKKFFVRKSNIKGIGDEKIVARKERNLSNIRFTSINNRSDVLINNINKVNILRNDILDDDRNEYYNINKYYSLGHYDSSLVNNNNKPLYSYTGIYDSTSNSSNIVTIVKNYKSNLSFNDNYINDNNDLSLKEKKETKLNKVIFQVRKVIPKL